MCVTQSACRRLQVEPGVLNPRDLKRLLEQANYHPGGEAWLGVQARGQEGKLRALRFVYPHAGFNEAQAEQRRL